MIAVDYATPKTRTGKKGLALHYVALVTAAATFPLIFMGGLVTSKQAGMSVPDWPTSWGYNMFALPFSYWVGGVFYEHTHRLMGTVVGFCSIILTIVAWKTESRRWVRWLATSVLAAVIFQGVLGGLRVVLVKLDLAIVHACVAQAFFCLTAFMALVTSRWWLRHVTPNGGTDIPVGDGARYSSIRSSATVYGDRSQTRMSVPPKEAPKADRAFVVACGFAVAIIYGQLIIGAVMRHYEAGLAIPDFPTTYGKILPPTTTAEVNHINLTHLDAPNFTLGQMWLAFGHRIGALLVTIALVTVFVMAIRRKIYIRSIVIIAGLLVAQITLGILTVLMKKPADIASLHVAVGALTLMTTFVLFVRAYVVAQPPSAVLSQETQNDFDEKAVGVPA